jgi:hypothetical protein
MKVVFSSIAQKTAMRNIGIAEVAKRESGEVVIRCEPCTDGRGAVGPTHPLLPSASVSLVCNPRTGRVWYADPEEMVIPLRGEITVYPTY